MVWLIGIYLANCIARRSSWSRAHLHIDEIGGGSHNIVHSRTFVIYCCRPKFNIDACLVCSPKPGLIKGTMVGIDININVVIGAIRPDLSFYVRSDTSSIVMCTCSLDVHEKEKGKETKACHNF